MGRGDGGTRAGSQQCQSLGSPSPLLLPPAAQSHSTVWGCRLWPLPEHTSGCCWPFGPFLGGGGGGFWQLCPEQGGCCAPQMPKAFHAAGCDGSCRGWHAGTGHCWRSLGLLGGQQWNTLLLCQGQSLGDSSAGWGNGGTGWAEHSERSRALCSPDVSRTETQREQPPARRWVGGGHSGHAPRCPWGSGLVITLLASVEALL